MKKIIKKFIKTIIIILMVVFILVVVNYIRNYRILTKIMKLSEENLSNLTTYTFVREIEEENNVKTILHENEKYTNIKGTLKDFNTYTWFDKENNKSVHFSDGDKLENIEIENYSDLEKEKIDNESGDDYETYLSAKDEADSEIYFLIAYFDFFGYSKYSDSKENSQEEKLKEILKDNLFTPIKIKQTKSFLNENCYEIKVNKKDILYFGMESGLLRVDKANYEGGLDVTYTLEKSNAVENDVRQPIPGMDDNTCSSFYNEKDYCVIDPDGYYRTNNGVDNRIDSYLCNAQKYSKTLVIRKYNDFNNYTNYTELEIGYDKESDALKIGEQLYNANEFKLIRQIRDNKFVICLVNLTNNNIMDVISYYSDSYNYEKYKIYEITNVDFEDETSTLTFDFQNSEITENGASFDINLYGLNEENQDEVITMTSLDAFYEELNISDIEYQAKIDLEYGKCSTNDYTGTTYNYKDYVLEIIEDENEEKVIIRK